MDTKRLVKDHKVKWLYDDCKNLDDMLERLKGEIISVEEAQTGYNDDLIMSLATGCYVRDTALKFAQQGIDLTNATLNNWQKGPQAIYSNKPNKGQIGWSQDMGEHGQQDLTWLL